MNFDHVPGYKGDASMGVGHIDLYLDWIGHSPAHVECQDENKHMSIPYEVPGRLTKNLNPAI